MELNKMATFLSGTVTWISSSASLIAGASQLPSKIRHLLTPSVTGIGLKEQRLLLVIQRQIECIIHPLQLCIIWARYRDSAVEQIIFNVQDILMSVCTYIQPYVDGSLQIYLSADKKGTFSHGKAVTYGGNVHGTSSGDGELYKTDLQSSSNSVGIRGNEAFLGIGSTIGGSNATGCNLQLQEDLQYCMNELNLAYSLLNTAISLLSFATHTYHQSDWQLFPNISSPSFFAPLPEIESIPDSRIDTCCKTSSVDVNKITSAVHHNENISSSIDKIRNILPDTEPLSALGNDYASFVCQRKPLVQNKFCPHHSLKSINHEANTPFFCVPLRISPSSLLKASHHLNIMREKPGDICLFVGRLYYRIVTQILDSIPTTNDVKCSSDAAEIDKFYGNHTGNGHKAFLEFPNYDVTSSLSSSSSWTTTNISDWKVLYPVALLRITRSSKGTGLSICVEHTPRIAQQPKNKEKNKDAKKKNELIQGNGSWMMNNGDQSSFGGSSCNTGVPNSGTYGYNMSTGMFMYEEDAEDLDIVYIPDPDQIDHALMGVSARNAAPNIPMNCTTNYECQPQNKSSLVFHPPVPSNKVSFGTNDDTSRSNNFIPSSQHHTSFYSNVSNTSSPKQTVKDSLTADNSSNLSPLPEGYHNINYSCSRCSGVKKQSPLFEHYNSMPPFIPSSLAAAISCNKLSFPISVSLESRLSSESQLGIQVYIPASHMAKNLNNTCLGCYSNNNNRRIEEGRYPICKHPACKTTAHGQDLCPVAIDHQALVWSWTFPLGNISVSDYHASFVANHNHSQTCNPSNTQCSFDLGTSKQDRDTECSGSTNSHIVTECSSKDQVNICNDQELNFKRENIPLTYQDLKRIDDYYPSKNICPENKKDVSNSENYITNSNADKTQMNHNDVIINFGNKRSEGSVYHSNMESLVPAGELCAEGLVKASEHKEATIGPPESHPTKSSKKKKKKGNNKISGLVENNEVDNSLVSNMSPQVQNNINRNLPPYKQEIPNSCLSEALSMKGTEYKHTSSLSSTLDTIPNIDNGEFTISQKNQADKLQNLAQDSIFNSVSITHEGKSRVEHSRIQSENEAFLDRKVQQRYVLHYGFVFNRSLLDSDIHSIENSGTSSVAKHSQFNAVNLSPLEFMYISRLCVLEMGATMNNDPINPCPRNINTEKCFVGLHNEASDEVLTELFRNIYLSGY